MGLLIYALYCFVTLEVTLLIGAAFYCFRLTRFTGAFRAWTFLISAMVLLAMGSTVSYVNMVFFYSSAQMDALVNRSTSIAFIATSAYGLGVSALLFLAMFELFKTFKRLRMPNKPLPSD